MRRAGVFQRSTGAKRCRFFCDEHVRETINAARRIAATPLGAVLSFERRLVPQDGTAPA